MVFLKGPVMRWHNGAHSPSLYLPPPQPSIFTVAFFFFFKVKCLGNSIFSHLPRRRSPQSGSQQCQAVLENCPASNPLHQCMENFQLLLVQVVKLLGQTVEAGFAVSHLPLGSCWFWYGCFRAAPAGSSVHSTPFRCLTGARLIGAAWVTCLPLLQF